MAKSTMRRKRRGKKGNYRAPMPRTIQIATKRNMNQTLKFVVNQTWVVDPTSQTAGLSAVLSYRANSIFQSHMPTSVTATAGVFKSQDPLKYNNNGSLTPVISQDADGYDTWKDRYQHFCVTGSKMTYTFEPTSTGAPSVLFSHLSGVSGAVNANTNSARFNTLPYVKRHSLSKTTLQQYGVRGSMNYSARKFEGVKDPDDNSNLRGRFANAGLVPPTTGATPGEQSFFYLALAPVDPTSTVASGGGVLRVKIEYIVHLKEPTESNQIQINPVVTRTSGGTTKEF